MGVPTNPTRQNAFVWIWVSFLISANEIRVSRGLFLVWGSPRKLDYFRMGASRCMPSPSLFAFFGVGVFFALLVDDWFVYTFRKRFIHMLYAGTLRALFVHDQLFCTCPVHISYIVLHCLFWGTLSVHFVYFYICVVYMLFTFHIWGSSYYCRERRKVMLSLSKCFLAAGLHNHKTNAML